jgi:hypothetical protein
MPPSQTSRALYQLRLILQLISRLDECAPIGEKTHTFASAFPSEDYSIGCHPSKLINSVVQSNANQ